MSKVTVSVEAEITKAVEHMLVAIAGINCNDFEQMRLLYQLKPIAVIYQTYLDAYGAIENLEQVIEETVATN